MVEDEYPPSPFVTSHSLSISESAPVVAPGATHAGRSKAASFIPAPFEGRRRNCRAVPGRPRIRRESTIPPSLGRAPAAPDRHKLDLPKTTEPATPSPPAERAGARASVPGAADHQG